MNQHQPQYVKSIFQCPLCNSVPKNKRDVFLTDIKYTVRRYGKNDVIVSQDAVYDFLYILIKGEISTEMADEKGDFMKIEDIKSPNPLATGFLFATNNLSPVTAIAKTDCTVILIPKENVYYLMTQYEEFMKAFLAYISNKVAFLSEKLRLASLRSIRAKVAYYLLRESKGMSEFELKMPKEQLARLFSVSRPALVNVMMQMDGEGIIKVEGRKITIQNRARLQQLF